MFGDCAHIASAYELSTVSDNLIIQLCNFTALLDSKKTRTLPPRKRLVRFGFDPKAHLAAACLFRLVSRHGAILRESWRHVVRCILSLNEMELLGNLVDGEPFEGRKKVAVKPKINNGQSSGLLSFIPGWWGGGSEPVEEEVDPEELEAESRAKQAISQCPIRAVIEGTGKLQSDSLVYLIKALIIDSSTGPNPGNMTAASEADASFCLELLTKIVLLNSERINFVWVLVADHFANIVQMAKSPSEFVEKAIVCLLLLCVTLAPRKEISVHVFHTLELFLKLEPAVATAMAESTIIAITRLLQSPEECIQTPSAWTVTLGIVERCANSAQAHQRGFHALSSLLRTDLSPPEGPALQVNAFRPYMRAVLAYVSVIDTRRSPKPSSAPQEILPQAENVPPVSVRAMNLLYGLYEGASSLPELRQDLKSREIHTTPLWRQYWTPVFLSLIRLCRDPRNEVRTHAMTLLQRALLSQQLELLTPEGLRVCFEDVMFPLFDTLLQPYPAAQSEASRLAVEETRVRGQQLLSKSLLQYLHQLTQLSDFHTSLWPRILSVLEQFMRADRIGLLSESIPEALKNILLVMLQMNFFHPSNTILGHDIWTVSWAMIDNFCPALKQDESFLSSLATFRKSLPWSLLTHRNSRSCRENPCSGSYGQPKCT